MNSWKTTGLGIVTLAYYVFQILNGHLPAATDLPAIASALGLIAAKDHSAK